MCKRIFSPSVETLNTATSRQDDFVNVILPAVRRAFHNRFRGLSTNERDELRQEVQARSWRMFVELIHQHREPLDFVGSIAIFAIRDVICGDRLAGNERLKDPMSSRAHAKGRCTLIIDNDYLADLHNTRTSVADQVAFDIDFKEWRDSLTPLERDIVDDLAMSYQLLEVSRKHRKSRNWGQYIRKQLRESWERFNQDESEVAA